MVWRNVRLLLHNATLNTKSMLQRLPTPAEKHLNQVILADPPARPLPLCHCFAALQRDEIWLMKRYYSDDSKLAQPSDLTSLYHTSHDTFDTVFAYLREASRPRFNAWGIAKFLEVPKTQRKFDLFLIGDCFLRVGRDEHLAQRTDRDQSLQIRIRLNMQEKTASPEDVTFWYQGGVSRGV